MAQFFGKYRGQVTAIDTSDGMWKIKASVPMLLGGHTTGWALPCLGFTFDKAKVFFEVSIGDMVWIEFEQGNIDKPIWTGGWFKKGKEQDKHGIEMDGTLLEWTEEKIVSHGDLEVKKNLRVEGDLEVTGNLIVNGVLYYKSMQRVE